MQIPVEPTPAATVLLAGDDPFRVLMLRRPSGGTFAGALVFPGGAVDAADRDPAWDAHVTGGVGLSPEQRAIRIAAIRETWEECGVLVAASAGEPAPGDVFLDVIRDAGVILHLDRLHYFSRWVTPSALPRRWDTRFYLAHAPSGAAPRVDGVELVSWEWVDPAAPPPGLLAPTRLNLARLAQSTGTAAAIAAAEGRERSVTRPELVEGGSFSLPTEAGYDNLRAMLD